MPRGKSISSLLLPRQIFFWYCGCLSLNQQKKMIEIICLLERETFKVFSDRMADIFQINIYGSELSNQKYPLIISTNEISVCDQSILRTY